MKRNVLELVGSFEQGGSERQAVQLSHELHRNSEFNIFVACLERKGPLISEIDWLERGSIPEFALSSFYNPEFLVQVRRCAGFLKEKEISLIHTHDFYTNIFGMVSGWVARVPVRIASKRETFSKTKRQMQVERQAYRLAHRVVINAEAVGQFLRKFGVADHKPTIIYNGLDLRRYASVPASDEKLTSNPVFSKLIGKRLVTIVANTRSDVKNHSMFLRAARRIVRELDSVEFVVAGEGDLLDALNSEAQALGIDAIVHFIGSCPDVPSLLSLSDVCVLSSRSEGFSNAILEYMAAGKPVVATRVGGASEAVLEGVTGFLVESDDDQAMAKRIIELLSEPQMAKQFGKKGRDRVERLFSLEVQLEKTIQLYEELLNAAKK